MKTFYFTFGSGHRNSDGSPLGNRYCPVEALDHCAAILKMQDKRKLRWSHVYDTPEKAGVEEFNLTPIHLSELGMQQLGT